MEVPAGQVNFRGSLPRSENNILQPMLHPVHPTNIDGFRLTISSTEFTVCGRPYGGMIPVHTVWAAAMAVALCNDLLLPLTTTD